MSESLSKRARRCVEVTLYAPLGVLAYARDAAPTLLTVLVARGRGEADRRTDEVAARVRHLKGYGDALVAFRPRLGGPADEVDSDATTTLEHDTAHETDSRDHAAVAEPPGDRTERIGTNGARSRGQATPLPIPSYDSLSASQVVERLPGLELDQLAMVRAYEQAHRGRRTILGKIDQLSA